MYMSPPKEKGAKVQAKSKERHVSMLAKSL